MCHMAKTTDPAKLFESLTFEMRRGVLVMAVLTQLHEPRYGYALKQGLAEQGLNIKEGTLYPLLRRLEDQGLLDSKWEVVNDARPRRYYQSNENGKALEAKLRLDWQQMQTVINTLLANSEQGDSHDNA